jgi:hypothetical protein
MVLDCGRRTTTNETVSEVPVLCELPVVGELFRSKSTEVVSDRLLVFVTPQVIMVDSGEESSAETTIIELPLFAQPVMCEEGMREAVRPTVEFLPIAPRPVCAPAVMPAGQLPCGPPCQACPVPPPVTMAPMQQSAGSCEFTFVPGVHFATPVMPPATAMPAPQFAGNVMYVAVPPMQVAPAMLPAPACCSFTAPAMPTPTMPHPVAVAAMTSATPPMMVRQVAAVAQPCCSSPDLQLVHLMIEYHEACATGDKAKARNLAARCIALDPTCFGR